MSNVKESGLIRKRVLTASEKRFIVGCILGDGAFSKSGKEVRLRIEHQEKHKEYLYWKFEKLKSLCLNSPQYVKQHKSYRFGTVGHSGITKLKDLFYNSNGEKEVPECIGKFMSAIGIAIWFMDDGNRMHNTVSISVHNFSEKSCGRLLLLMETFGVNAKIHFDGHGKRIYVPQKFYRTFNKLVKPYVEEIPCMAYKLP